LRAWLAEGFSLPRDDLRVGDVKLDAWIPVDRRVVAVADLLVQDPRRVVLLPPGEVFVVLDVVS